MNPEEIAKELIRNFKTKEMALKATSLINRLAGMPQFQIIFWRKVQEILKNIK